MAEWTDKQGAYLAFIYAYTEINGRAPAEKDMQRFFQTSPPTVHQMVEKLHTSGLIDRTPRVAIGLQRVAGRDLPAR